MRDDNSVGKLHKIGYGTIPEHRLKLSRRTGKNKNMNAVLFNRHAGCGSVIVWKNHTVLRKHGLLEVVLCHFHALGAEIGLYLLNCRLVQKHFFAEKFTAYLFC